MAQIGIDATAALTQGGGIGRYTRELIAALAVHKSPHQFTLFSAKPPPNPPVATPLPSNLRHTPAPLDARWLYRLWYRARLPLPVQLVTGPLDLFHSPDFVLPPVSGGIPTLLTVHDLSFVHYPETFTPSLVNYLTRVVPRSVRRATHVLADSDATKADLMSLWDVPEAKVTVLYSGVHDRFRPVQDEAAIRTMRQRYGLGHAPYILAVGTIQPRKNYRLLIQAFARMAHHWPHKLVIAGGKGWLFDEILAEVAAHDLDERVHFPGFIDEADLPALYSEATLLVFPSLYEGFGLPIVEAMACGVPVLASDTSSLPEVVGDAGLLISPHDVDQWTHTIHRLLLDAPQRARMVAQGAIQAHQFTWRKAARSLLDVYAALLDR